jgi:hypothetical protein
MTEFDIAGNDFERAADALTAAHFEKVAGKIVAGALRADANWSARTYGPSCDRTAGPASCATR